MNHWSGSQGALKNAAESSEIVSVNDFSHPDFPHLLWDLIQQPFLPSPLLSFLITTDAELTGTVVLWCVTIQSSCGSSSPRSSLWISGSRCSRIQRRKLR